MKIVGMLLCLFFFLGCASTPCMCPSVETMVVTEAGPVVFEPGELDQDLPYLIRGEKLMEFRQEMEKLIQMQKGDAL